MLEGAQAFARNPCLFASDLTREQLVQILCNQGVPARDAKRLRKGELVQRVQQLPLWKPGCETGGSSSQSREQQALDDRSVAAQEHVKHFASCFSRLATALMVALSHFCDLRSLAALSCCNRFLRVRTSVSLKNSPSPALTALRSFHSAHIRPSVLQALLPRTSHLQSLSIGYKGARFGAAFPAALREFRLQESKIPLEICVDALRVCCQLEIMDIHCCSDVYVVRRSASKV